MSRSRVTVGLITLVAVMAVFAVSCTKTSETTEMSDDPADITVPGVPPTAPPTTVYDGRGLSSDAKTLVANLAAVESETDLCTILTGDSFAPFLDGKVDATNLVTSPSGLNQLLVTVNSIFDHIVEIAPSPIQPSLVILQDVWSRVSSLSSAAPEYQSQVDAIAAEPQVAAAYQALGTWVASNCGSTALLPTA